MLLSFSTVATLIVLDPLCSEPNAKKQPQVVEYFISVVHLSLPDTVVLMRGDDQTVLNVSLSSNTMGYHPKHKTSLYRVSAEQ